MAPNQVRYEWDMEELDPTNLDPIERDILDHNHADQLWKLGGLPNKNQRLVLVRDEGNDLDGLTDRLWAYVSNDWTLPEYFCDSEGKQTMVKVPARFHKELAKQTRGERV